MRKITLALTFLILITSKVSAQKMGWIRAQFNDLEFSYPDNWTIDSSGLMQTKFVAFSPDTTDSFRPNINLVIQDLSASPMTLKQYQNLSETQMKQYFNQFNLIQSEIDQSQGLERLTLIYQFQQGAYALTGKSYGYKKGNSIYLLTFTATQRHYPNVEKLGTAVMNTLIFRPNK